MSKINYRRKEWKIKLRKPVSIRPCKFMDNENPKVERHHVREKLHELLKELSNETSQEL